MKFTLAFVATVFTLASGCALNGTAKQQSNATGSSAAGATASGAGPGGRTREEVHAEALEAARHHRSTMQEELEYFLPWGQQ